MIHTSPWVSPPRRRRSTHSAGARVPGYQSRLVPLLCRALDKAEPDRAGFHPNVPTSRPWTASSVEQAARLPSSLPFQYDCLVDYPTGSPLSQETKDAQADRHALPDGTKNITMITAIEQPISLSR